MLPWCELAVEVDTLLNEGGVDSNQVQHRWGEGVLLCQVPEKQVRWKNE